ncbi:unnamed protein product [Paramecium sonneborni]|uniref:Uncharacterized protein n=1 Tax=Paramecium sonneborni TaxID=65129 RepID=A0A8S1RKI9_9CILI|nr:unnamed protein product [Paramecium sonneborni]
MNLFSIASTLYQILSILALTQSNRFLASDILSNQCRQC